MLEHEKKVLNVKVDPKKESYAKGEILRMEVESVQGAGFYVWRIHGYGQRAVETKAPQLAITFKDKSDLSRDPVEIGLGGAPSRINLKICVSAFDSHYYYTLLGEGKFEVSLVCT